MKVRYLLAGLLPAILVVGCGGSGNGDRLPLTATQCDGEDRCTWSLLPDEPLSTEYRDEIQRHLRRGPVTVELDTGDMDIDIAINSVGTHPLTLVTHGNLKISQPISLPNGKLVLVYGGANPDASYRITAPVTLPAGESFELTGPDGVKTTFTVITALGNSNSSDDGTLQGMRGALDGHFALGAEIDASPTAEWNEGAGFAPVGNAWNITFNGTFEGLGNVIRNLNIHRPSSSYVGLFGHTDGASLRHLSLFEAAITGQDYVGPLAGQFERGAIVACHASGLVGGTSSGDSVGGLVGRAITSNIVDSYSTVDVSGGRNQIGGLLGSVDGASVVIGSHASGKVQALRDQVGGLVGYVASNAIVSSSYATGAVEGLDGIGGLAGFVRGTIEDSYATGAVEAEKNAGGLVGSMLDGEVRRSHATGDVLVSERTAGGLVGWLWGDSRVIKSHASGAVDGVRRIGGLVGYVTGSARISEGHASGDAAGAQNVGGLVGALDLSSVSADTASINNSFATGAVFSESTADASSGVGGLVGGCITESANIVIGTSYSLGSVAPLSPRFGGLIGFANSCAVSASFWDTGSSGQPESAGGIGKVRSELQTFDTFSDASWDISAAADGDSIWWIDAGNDTPRLRSLLEP
ncbi:MAG: GLUG motif-containing protein [Alcanivoracaceae bacterium]